MSDFENDLKNAINTNLEEIGEGIAYRRKQAQYTSQILDVIVDNPYIGIECKSVSKKSSKKLYFSQHFSEDQVERTTEFLDKSDRAGFLALEIRRGRGKSRQAYLIPWWWVHLTKISGYSGIPFSAVRDRVGSKGIVEEIPREGGDYKITDKILKMFWTGGYLGSFK